MQEPCHFNETYSAKLLQKGETNDTMEEVSDNALPEFLELFDKKPLLLVESTDEEDAGFYLIQIRSTLDNL